MYLSNVFRLAFGCFAFSLRCCVAVSLLGLAHGLSAAGDDAVPVPGVVCRSLSSAKDPEQSYAVYLPVGYRADQVWPVVFCFDPAARGSFVVERFSGEAERWGYILVCSNRSRNGPMEPIIAAARAVMVDAGDRFSIDWKRVYFAGHSGGASVCVALAGFIESRGILISGLVGGVRKEVSIRMAGVFGASGDGDFNFYPLKQYVAQARQHGLASRFVEFKGGHDWIDAESMGLGLRWFRFLALRDSLIPMDEAFVSEEWDFRLSALDALEQPDRFREGLALVKDFEGLRDTAALAGQLDELAKARVVKSAGKREREDERLQREITSGILQLAVSGSRREVEEEVVDLRQQIESTKDAVMVLRGRRVLTGLMVGGMEQGKAARRAKDFERAERLIYLASLADPEAGWIRLELAKSRAQLADRRGTISALIEAKQLGVDIGAKTAADPVFDTMREDVEFRAAIEE